MLSESKGSPRRHTFVRLFVTKPIDRTARVISGVYQVPLRPRDVPGRRCKMRNRRRALFRRKNNTVLYVNLHRERASSSSAVNPVPTRRDAARNIGASQRRTSKSKFTTREPSSYSFAAGDYFLAMNHRSESRDRAELKSFGWSNVINAW